MKVIFLWIFCGCFTGILCLNTDDHNGTADDPSGVSDDHNGTALYRILFENYNPKVRPVFNVYTPTVVNISLELVKILQVDEVNQTFKTTVNILIMWLDQLLTWNGQDFGDIYKLVFPFDNNIWMPDLMNINAAYHPGEFGQKYAFPSVYYFGLVIIWSRVNLETQCLIHTKKFPLDIQYCRISFSTFSSTDDEVRIRNTSNSISMEYYTKTAEWSIIENYVTTQRYMIDGLLPFRDISYHLTLKRTCTSCIMNNIVPIIVLAFLNLLSFFVPSESGEKLTFPMSIFLTLAVFLTIIMMSLPESVDGVSYLSTFVTFELSVSAVTLLCTVITLRLHHEMGDARVPVIARLMVRVFRWNYLASRTKTYPKEKENDGFTQEMLPGKTEIHGTNHTTCGAACGEAASGTTSQCQDINIKWDHVSDAFDMLMFVVVLILQIIATATFLTFILT